MSWPEEKSPGKNRALVTINLAPKGTLLKLSKTHLANIFGFLASSQSIDPFLAHG
jgi:hypothetical protein